MPSDAMLLFGVSSVVGGIVWLVRLEGRVNAHDEALKQTREDISYVRKRIDEALNGHGRH